MILNEFNVIEKTIKSRRSMMPQSDHKLDDDEIMKLLELANWAPTHRFTEPWRFIVYARDAVKRFCFEHGELYRTVTDPKNFQQSVYDTMLHYGDKTSHIVLAYMKRDKKERVSVVEEISATAAAIQNILLGAEASGINIMWCTDGLTLDPAMGSYLGLEQKDKLLGMLHVGYSPKSRKPGKRKTSIKEKVKWFD